MPCPFCDAPLLGNPRQCPSCGRALPAAAPAAGDDVFGLLDESSAPTSSVVEHNSPPPDRSSPAAPDPIGELIEHNSPESSVEVPLELVPG
ncbi:MAG: hypothetical protein JXR83_16755, partial [Deltaproteobacteria bacterium]|nr:hypothetical protein [Deltaproteobacteria bacterium]